MYLRTTISSLCFIYEPLLLFRIRTQIWALLTANRLLKPWKFMLREGIKNALCPRPERQALKKNGRPAKEEAGRPVFTASDAHRVPAMCDRTQFCGDSIRVSRVAIHSLEYRLRQFLPSCCCRLPMTVFRRIPWSETQLT